MNLFYPLNCKCRCRSEREHLARHSGYFPDDPLPAYKILTYKQLYDGIRNGQIYEQDKIEIVFYSDEIKTFNIDHAYISQEIKEIRWYGQGDPNSR